MQTGVAASAPPGEISSAAVTAGQEVEFLFHGTLLALILLSVQIRLKSSVFTFLKSWSLGTEMHNAENVC